MPLPVPRQSSDQETKRAKHQAVFDAWLVECGDIRDLVVEQLLTNLPSLKDAYGS